MKVSGFSKKFWVTFPSFKGLVSISRYETLSSILGAIAALLSVNSRFCLIREIQSGLTMAWSEVTGTNLKILWTHRFLAGMNALARFKAGFPLVSLPLKRSWRTRMNWSDSDSEESFNPFTSKTLLATSLDPNWDCGEEWAFSSSTSKTLLATFINSA